MVSLRHDKHEDCMLLWCACIIASTAVLPMHGNGRVALPWTPCGIDNRWRCITVVRCTSVPQGTNMRPGRPRCLEVLYAERRLVIMLSHAAGEVDGGRVPLGLIPPRWLLLDVAALLCFMCAVTCTPSKQCLASSVPARRLQTRQDARGPSSNMWPAGVHLKQASSSTCRRREKSP